MLGGRWHPGNRPEDAGGRHPVTIWGGGSWVSVTCISASNLHLGPLFHHLQEAGFVTGATSAVKYRDADLVARMAVKEPGALDELWSRHARTAFAMAIGIVRDRVRAEQAVSEAFREAFNTAAQFVPGELTVLAWLTSLTRRRAEAMTPSRA